MKMGNVYFISSNNFFKMVLVLTNNNNPDTDTANCFSLICVEGQMSDIAQETDMELAQASERTHTHTHIHKYCSMMK